MSYLPENEPTIELSVPCDEVNILIDCDPRKFDRTTLTIAVGKNALTIVRTDEYMIQVRRLSKLQPLNYGFMGLARPLDFVVLDYDEDYTGWRVPDDLPVKEPETMHIFASLVTGFTKNRLLHNVELRKHIA